MGLKEFIAGGKARRERIRKFIRRSVTVFVIFYLWCIKPFPFLHWMAFGKLRNFVTYWTSEMLWVYIASWGTRVLADQPSTPKIPADFKPVTVVDDPWKLTEADVKFFYDRGYLAPIKLFSPDEMAELLREVESEVFEGGNIAREWQVAGKFTPSKIYQGLRTGRDRHLDTPAVAKLALQQGIFDRVAQLLGPNLLLWRTQLLPKPPGAPETAWHQVSTFTLSGKALRPVIEPEDRNELFNVTAWLALEDVDIENGCMQFWRGSHRKPLHKMNIAGGGQKFASTAFQLECDIKPEELDDCVLKAGEFVIFHERTVHGAPWNGSKTRRRFGMNYRICRPDVYVYRGMTIQHGNTFAETYDLEKWTTILARGEDKFKRNKVITPAQLQERLAEYQHLQVAGVGDGPVGYSN